MTDKPTPKEIYDLVYELRQAGKDDTYSLARAVLAKWGTPAPADSLVGDSERLAWMADGWTQGHEKLYVQHVLKTGGVGDVDDLRTFIDKQMAAQPAAQQVVAYAAPPNDEQIWAAREAWSKQANEHEAMRAALIAGCASHGQAPAGTTVYPMACDEDESDLGAWQDGATKPTIDGIYLRDFDEGQGTSEFYEGKWLRDGFFPSDIQDARWRGRNAPQPSPAPQADSQPAPGVESNTAYALPDFDTVEQHIYGACRRYITQDMLEPIHNLIREAVDANRASHGQAPAGESLRTDALCDLSYSHGLKAGWNYCASDDLAGFERAQKIGAEALRTLKSPTAQAADSVQEDAARYRLVRRGQHWSVIDGIGNDLRAEALDAAIDAARKQGEKQ